MPCHYKKKLKNCPKVKIPLFKRKQPPLARSGWQRMVPCTSFPGRGAGRRQRGMTGYVGRGRSQASTFCAHLCTHRSPTLVLCLSASEHGGEATCNKSASCQCGWTNQEKCNKKSCAEQANSSEKVPFQAEPVSACLPEPRPTAWRSAGCTECSCENATDCTALRGRQLGSSVTAGREHVSGPSSGVQSASNPPALYSTHFVGAAPHC